MGTKAVSQARGRTGRVFINGIELCVTNWELTITAQEEDTTSSCSAGYEEFEYGVTGAQFTLDADWDITKNIHSDPPNLVPGDVIDTLKLYVHSDSGTGLEDGPYYSFAAGVGSIRITTPAKGKVTYSISGRSRGAITYPTSNQSGTN